MLLRSLIPTLSPAALEANARALMHRPEERVYVHELLQQLAGPWSVSLARAWLSILDAFLCGDVGLAARLFPAASEASLRLPVECLPEARAMFERDRAPLPHYERQLASFQSTLEIRQRLAQEMP